MSVNAAAATPLESRWGSRGSIVQCVTTGELSLGAHPSHRSFPVTQRCCTRPDCRSDSPPLRFQPAVLAPNTLSIHCQSAMVIQVEPSTRVSQVLIVSSRTVIPPKTNSERVATPRRWWTAAWCSTATRLLHGNYRSHPGMDAALETVDSGGQSRDLHSAAWCRYGCPRRWDAGCRRG